MNLLKKNIWIYISVGVFLLPHIFNNLHFALVSHAHEWKFEHSDENSFHAKVEFHNCEQYLFKVPPATELDLTYEFEVHFNKNFKELIEIEYETLIQNNNYAYPKRGPPDLI